MMTEDQKKIAAFLKKNPKKRVVATKDAMKGDLFKKLIIEPSWDTVNRKKLEQGKKNEA